MNNIRVIDTSFGQDATSNRLVRTAHVDIPRPHQPARHTVLQAVIEHHVNRQKSRAAVRVLTDRLMWTEVLVLEKEDWLGRVPDFHATSENGVFFDEELNKLADELFERAAAILGY